METSIYTVGDKINNWEVVNIYKSKNSYRYDLRCSCCNKTMRTNLWPSEIKYRLGSKCNSCATIERNTKNRSVKQGNRYGKLTVIADAGYKEYYGKRRHFSLVQCDCGSAIFEAMDNRLQSGTLSSCGCIISKGEEKIKNWLEKNNLNYSKEFSFKDLINPKTNARLRFDFCVFNDKGDIFSMIEFDGKQHEFGPDTKTWSRTSDTLEDIQYRDKLKNDYCLNHNINLIRINYKQFSLIEKILENELKGLVKEEDDK